jgi:hypothetical protein
MSKSKFDRLILSKTSKFLCMINSQIPLLSCPIVHSNILLAVIIIEVHVLLTILAPPPPLSELGKLRSRAKGWLRLLRLRSRDGNVHVCGTVRANEGSWKCEGTLEGREWDSDETERRCGQCENSEPPPRPPAGQRKKERGKGGSEGGERKGRERGSEKERPALVGGEEGGGRNGGLIGTTRSPSSNQNVLLDFSPSRRKHSPCRSCGNFGFKCCRSTCWLRLLRLRRRRGGVHKCALMQGVGRVKGYGKGGRGRRLRREATETEWLGDPGGGQKRRPVNRPVPRIKFSFLFFESPATPARR